MLVEKNPTTSDEAKAISLDDESLRTLQSAGLDEAVYPIIVPGHRDEVLLGVGKPLLHARGPAVRRLRASVQEPVRPARPGARAVRPDSPRFDHVDVELRHPADRLRRRSRRGTSSTMRGQGGRTGDASGRRTCSAATAAGARVRDLLGIPMERRAASPTLWLVADTLRDTHDERYGMHVGDPRRPHVIVAGRDGRCRYEFKLRPGEATPGSQPTVRAGATTRRAVPGDGTRAARALGRLQLPRARSPTASATTAASCSATPRT